MLGFRNFRKSQKRKKDIKTTLVQKPNILRKKVRKRKWMQNFIIFISFLIYFFLLKVAIQNDEKKEKKLFIFFLPFLFYFCSDTRLEVVLINENEYDNDQCSAEKMSIYFIYMFFTQHQKNNQVEILMKYFNDYFIRNQI